MPGISPGARIHDGTATSSAAIRWLVRRCSPAYIIRAAAAVCSAYSLMAELWLTVACSRARMRPSGSAPMRRCETVWVR